MTTTNPAPAAAESVESRASWTVAIVALLILALTYGAPLLVVVGLKPIAADLGAPRSQLALAGALAFLGAGTGGIFMGWVADRIGVRWTVLAGGTAVAAGLAVSTIGGVWPLLLGHFVLVGLLGNGGIYAPLMIYVSRWFDRRRGTALALLSSGQYVAGTLWPSVFQAGFDRIGWRATMLGFAALVVLGVAPLALLFLRAPPVAARAGGIAAGPREGAPVLGLRPNTVLALLCGAGFLCCVPMAIPGGHLVAYCTDVGLSPDAGAAMLSVMLACAFVSRQFWGWVADRLGGLRTVLLGSAAQALALAGFLLTQSEIGLFSVAAAYGLGFSGIIPAYVLAVRDLFPAREASWRVPLVLFTSMTGMAVGGWFAGVLFDHFGHYAPAFAAGIAFNVANLFVIGSLVTLRRRTLSLPAYG